MLKVPRPWVAERRAVEYPNILASGTTAEIVENAEVRRVYLGENFRM